MHVAIGTSVTETPPQRCNRPPGPAPRNESVTDIYIYIHTDAIWLRCTISCLALRRSAISYTPLLWKKSPIIVPATSKRSVFLYMKDLCMMYTRVLRSCIGYINRKKPTCAPYTLELRGNNAWAHANAEHEHLPAHVLITVIRMWLAMSCHRITTQELWLNEASTDESLLPCGSSYRSNQWIGRSTSGLPLSLLSPSNLWCLV